MPDAPSLDDGLLLECVVTSTLEDGSTNVAPMGPIVAPAFDRFLLRPFQTSATFANLVRERRCVLNITDDVELIARAALDLLQESPPLESAPNAHGHYLSEACRWFALEVDSIDDSRERCEVVCHSVGGGSLREFVGFNRAMHAVIEATILATRLHLLPRDDVLRELDRLASPVQKTGGPRERRAFEMVRKFVSQPDQ